MRGRFRRRRTNFGRARRIVRAVSGITLAKRVILDGLTIPDVTSVSFDNILRVPLLECVETMDEEVESNGTTIADAPLYSRMTSMKLQLILHGFAAGSMVRWILHKEPDGEQAYTELTNTSFHVSDDNEDNRERRKYCLAKGMIFINPNNLATRFPIFVKKQAWRRVSPLREGDIIALTLAKDAAGTTGALSGFGTIWVKANA